MLIGSRRWLAGLRDRNQVRIAPKIEKRCNGMDALPNFTADQKLGGMVDGSRCQQPWFSEIRGRCNPLKPMTDGNSGAAAIVRVNVQVPFGIVEFIDPGGCHGVGRSQHAEVESRVLHWNGPLHILALYPKLTIALNPGVRSQVTDEILWQSIVTAGVHRAHREAIAVSEHKVAIQPGLGTTRKSRLIQLSC